MIESSVMDRLLEMSIPEPNSGCLLWCGDYYPDGYGRIQIKGRRGRAHRISWEVANGRSAGELFVCHWCDVPACINPQHLFLGTCRENNVDRSAKGRTCRVFGEEHAGAKFDRIQALKILADSRPNSVIAREYGVSRVTISRIKRGIRWPHLQRGAAEAA